MPLCLICCQALLLCLFGCRALPLCLFGCKTLSLYLFGRYALPLCLLSISRSNLISRQSSDPQDSCPPSELGLLSECRHSVRQAAGSCGDRHLAPTTARTLLLASEPSSNTHPQITFPVIDSLGVVYTSRSTLVAHSAEGPSLDGFSINSCDFSQCRHSGFGGVGGGAPGAFEKA